MRILQGLIGMAGLTVVAAAPAPAQQARPSSEPWAAFYGCWAPLEGARSLAVTCMVPVEGLPLASEQLSVVGGSIVRSVMLSADGARRDFDADGCKGWESAAFSVDGFRVYTSGSATCDHGGEQRTSGVLSITPRGELLQVAAVRVGEQRTVTTHRLELLRWVELPPALHVRLAASTKLAQGARTRAARSVDFASLEDALTFADAHVVEAWMVETGTGEGNFVVTRRELQRLVAMNAPTSIIDLSVALANPDRFEPRVERRAGARSWDALNQQTLLGLGGSMQMDAFCDQLQFGMVSRGAFAPMWTMLMYAGMGTSYYGRSGECIGRGFFSRWGFGPYGYGNWFNGPFGDVPSSVVVTTTPRRAPGTVTKGEGYTRGASSTPTGSTGQTRTNSGPSTVRASTGQGASSTGGGEGSSSPGGTRSAGSNGTGRTAQPRNPQ